ncbi:hypothetical protein EBR96_06350 [bacterium]|nr:hypothetical protein [bacterium]
MITANELLLGLSQCHHQSVLVIGDLMLDEYHWCAVNRISPEAPVPICRVESTTLVPGGAANVANNLVQLGASVRLLGVIGKDSTGDRLLNALKFNHISTTDIIVSATKPTILKSRIIAHHQHVVRVDREDSSPIDRTLQKTLFQRIQSYSKRRNKASNKVEIKSAIGHTF